MAILGALTGRTRWTRSPCIEYPLDLHICASGHLPCVHEDVGRQTTRRSYADSSAIFDAGSNGLSICTVGFARWSGVYDFLVRILVDF